MGRDISSLGEERRIGHLATRVENVVREAIILPRSSPSHNQVTASSNVTLLGVNTGSSASTPFFTPYAVDGGRLLTRK